jgi:hypothetical protein
VLPGRIGYEDLRRAFRWRNIGVAIADRCADREPERLAIVHQRPVMRLLRERV